MKIPRGLLEQLVEHTREDPRNEVCGVVAVEANGAPPGEARAVRVHRARNIHASPLRFEIDPKELLELSNDIEDHGGEIGGIYHSHVRSRPYPSQTDINFAANWPGLEWVIVGVAGAGEPEIRSYMIEGGAVTEAPIETGVS